MREHGRQLEGRLERDVNALDFQLIWDDLVHERWIVDGEPGDVFTYQDLLHEAKRLAKQQRVRGGGYTGPRPGRSSGAVVEARLEPWEQAYVDTRARYLELRAEKWPGVIRFRQEVLGGRSLGSDEALNLVESPLAAYVSSDWFESKGVPILGHAANVVDWESRSEGGENRERVVFFVDPPGQNVEVFGRGIRDRQRNRLQYVTDEGYVETWWVERESVLHRLNLASNALANALFADAAGASSFILTGKWPPRPPLEAEMGIATITLTAAPWISATTLRSFFLQLQRRYREGDNRPVSEKARAVLLFVTEHTDERGERPSFDKLTPMWNERYPEWHFKSRSGLYDAYRRAERGLVPAPHEDIIESPS